MDPGSLLCDDAFACGHAYIQAVARGERSASSVQTSFAPGSEQARPHTECSIVVSLYSGSLVVQLYCSDTDRLQPPRVVARAALGGTKVSHYADRSNPDCIRTALESSSKEHMYHCYSRDQKATQARSIARGQETQRSRYIQRRRGG